MASSRSSAALLGALLAAHTSARAGGFATGKYAGEHGHPATDNPSAIYYNPAGLALGHGTRVLLEGLFAWRVSSYDRPVGAIDHPLAQGEEATGTPADAIDGNSGEATLSDLLVSPFLGVVSDLGVEHLGLGLAVFAPFGGQASWDKTSRFESNLTYPGLVDGPQRWSTIEGELREIYFAAGGAYTLPGDVSIGLAANLIRQNVETLRARTATGTDDIAGPDGNVIEGRSLIDVSGWTFSLALGAVWQPVAALRIGASYQSQPGFGETSQSGELENKFGSSAPDVTQIDFLQSLPDVYRLGASFQATPDLELRLSGDYQRWSVFDKQCLVDSEAADANCSLNPDGSTTADARGVIVSIPRDWHDTFGVHGGASYWVLPELELDGGLAFDSSAVPDKTMDVSLPDMNKVTATAGVGYVVSPSLLLSATLNNVYYFRREVAPRERDAMGEPIGYAEPSRVPDGAGVYKQNVVFMNLGAEYRF
jgi:long-chain fatty acid transport protein